MKYKFVVLGMAVAAIISTNAVSDEALDRVHDALTSILPQNLPLNSVIESPISGVYEASISNQIYYVFEKDGYLIIGDAIDLRSGTSLSDKKTEQAVYEIVNSTRPSNMVVFTAADPKRHVTVFTDIDCGYCRRFHQEVPQLTAAGMEVRYMAFPRAGVESESYNKIVNVWCSDDQQKAMTDAKNGVKLPAASCTNPIADQYRQGVQAGINGTPTLVLDDGTMIGGYVPADELLSRVGLSSN
jgi:thiol:disulfide interchange protein DsbC